jgi:hypothetical protein
VDIIDFFIIISMYGTALLTVRCVWLCVASSDTTHDEKVRKTASFLEISLCLSRACLGKMIVFKYKWLKNAFFAGRGGLQDGRAG